MQRLALFGALQSATLLLICLVGHASAGRGMLDASVGTEGMDMGMGGMDMGMDMGMGGMDMGGGMPAGSTSPDGGMPAADSSGMGGMGGGGMGGPGSRNMSSPCYTEPSADACAGFQRTDADWSDDLSQLCSAMPFLVGCSLYRQCQNASFAGVYCQLASLTGNICSDDKPGMSGCEAWQALCGNDTAVEQCTSPGPVPGVITTREGGAKQGIESLCASHCMSGCPDCQAGSGWGTCKDPLSILAYMCWTMPTMPECGAMYGTGISEMCADPDVAASFPLTCSNPPEPTAQCP